jgi:nucleoside-diphosphate-sugar epimerase
MKKVLVTGGFGYVGSRLVPLLLEKGYFVRVIDLCLYGEFGFDALKKHANFTDFESRFDFIKGDIRDPKTVDRATKGIDSVIHLAAISNDPTGDMDEVLTRQVNFDAVGLLLTSAKRNGVQRFINASSSSVFGVKGEENITENLEPEPITYYSKYKMLSEWLVVSSHSDDFCTVNVRPATICGYSPRQRFDLTVNKLTLDGVTKGQITVHGGEQRRPNVGMTDIINFYVYLLGEDKAKINGRTFNFGFENNKIIDIAKIIKSEIDKDRDVEISVTDTFDKRDYHISSQKMLDILSYKPVSSIPQEVQELKARISEFQDTESKYWYNMKSMVLDRTAKAYESFN